MAALRSTIATWAQLANVAEECSGERWVFRGETAQNRDLKPKAGRVGEKGSARKQPYDPAHEREALADFKRRARPYLTHSPSSDLEWLAIAQHHGMSTRLLDWTMSILVAAFFAAEKAGTRGDALIYGVKGIPIVTEGADPFSITAPGVYLPPHITPRIPSQGSVFTVHPDPTQVFAPTGMREWTISSSACGGIKRVLDDCGINQSSLFPDIDGLARYLGWRYKWGKF